MKTNAPKRFRVRRGDLSLLVAPWRGRWRFAWRKDAHAPRKWVTASTKEEIQALAEEKLEAIAAGDVEWSALPERRKAFLREVHRESTEEDQAAILAFIASRRRSTLLPAAVQRFLEDKAGGKPEKPHLKMVRRDLENLAAKHPHALVSDVTEEQLREWWAERNGTAGDARKKAIRTNLVTFWLWAQKKGMTGGDPITVAQQLPAIDPKKGKIEIFERQELEFLLSVVSYEFFPFVLLGAFEGIRPEEIAPKSDNPKERLRWEHVDWDWNVIRIPAEVAKTGRGKKPHGRIVPLHPATRAWLEVYGAGPTWTGAICPENPSEAYRKEPGARRAYRPTATWGKALAKEFPARFTGWPKDALRHSYASYRIAVLQSLQTVMLEMGNSEEMLHGHYNNPRTKQQGEAWFDFFPQDARVLAPYLKLPSPVPIRTKNSGAKAG